MIRLFFLNSFLIEFIDAVILTENKGVKARIKRASRTTGAKGNHFWQKNSKFQIT